MHKGRNRVVSLLVMAVIVLGLFTALPTPAFAELGEYHAGDVAVINAIIENNGLAGYGYAKDDPDNWVFAEWNTNTPKRVETLFLSRVEDDPKPLVGLLDVSGLTYLRSLACSENALTALNLGGLTSLTYLGCDDNNITELDVSGLAALEILRCYSNNLTELNLSHLTALESLYCYGNNLTELNLSGLSSLNYVHCSDNNLTTLSSSGLKNLEILICDNNDLSSIDVCGSTNLTQLSCYGNDLSELDVSELTNLIALECSANNISELDLSGLTKILGLWCGENELTTLDLGDIDDLWLIYCNGNNLTSLDVSGFTKLHTLHCYDNYMPMDEGAGVIGLSDSTRFENWGIDTYNDHFVYSPQRMPSTSTAPRITGPTSMSINTGYATVSSDVFTITGTTPITVAKTSGAEQITWNDSAKKLDIATGLAAGTYPVVLTANNGTAPDATHTFTLTVTDAVPPVTTAPGITGPTSMSINIGYRATSSGAYTITGTAPVTVTKTSGAEQITWNDSTKKLDIAAGLIAGIHRVELTASNGTAPDATLVFTLTVTDVPQTGDSATDILVWAIVLIGSLLSICCLLVWKKRWKTNDAQ